MEGVELTSDTWRLAKHREVLTLLTPIILSSENKAHIEEYLGLLREEGAFSVASH